MTLNAYYDEADMLRRVQAGEHRAAIGGLWDDMGRRQLEFLIGAGLRPQHRLLDVGCGSLRLGAAAIPYLDPERYFGTDLSQALMDAGWSRELDDAGRLRAPRSHLHQTEDFDFDFLPEPVDVAIAQSVFTHLPLNHLRRCLARLAPRMREGGTFFVTYFELPSETDRFSPLTHTGPSGETVVTHDHKDPFHYSVEDLAWAARGTPWRLRRIGDWGHPRGQFMAAFER